MDKMENKGKVIFLDFGMFLHRSIFVWRNQKNIPPEYTCLNMIISCLRKIGIEPFDTIIVACDKGRSWRKDIEKEYKAGRKEYREKFTDIDWKVMYQKFDELLEKIELGTDWYIMKENGLEADDWMAVGCRYFKNKEVILVSFDADMEQLCIYNNVKVFSPMIKMKGAKGGYKVVINPYQILAKKIEKETADNLVNPILTNQDYEKRKMIVSLLELPDFVEQTCQDAFSSLQPKEDFDIEYVPFSTIRKKLDNIYNDKSKVVTYEECVESRLRKLRRKKKNGEKSKRKK